METHKSGLGSKYVRANSPFKLIYQEDFEDKIAAAKREWEIKSWNRKKKIETLKLEI
jgi:predicted GIY-YIG superfamily endonuclease